MLQVEFDTADNSDVVVERVSAAKSNLCPMQVIRIEIAKVHSPLMVRIVPFLDHFVGLEPMCCLVVITD